jgi:hypothetical protein
MDTLRTYRSIFKMIHVGIDGAIRSLRRVSLERIDKAATIV